LYATIRRYRVDADLSSRVIEEFMPLMKGHPGIRGYYLLDAQDGAFVTLTICENQAALEASNTMANDWMRQYLATNLLRQQSIRPFSVEVKEVLQGPLYGGLSERIRANQGATWLEPRRYVVALG
jgi:hypothetical protein